MRNDAWNRLAGVFRNDGNTPGQLDSADTLVAAYRYDGLNRRIAKIIPLYADSQNPTTPTGYDRTDYLFNLDWQVLEERFEGNVGTDLKDTPAEAVHVQYVWDIRYIDTPVLRIRDTAGPTGPDGALDPAVDEVVYYLTDGNMNVTALVDGTAGSPTAGQVVERYMYDAYGKATILNGPADADNHPNATEPSIAPDWSVDADQKSDLGNTISFAGYPLDAETGLYCVRHRYYGPTIGRWTSADPAGYVDGMNLYQYVEARPNSQEDPSGLFHIEFVTEGPCAGQAIYRDSWYDWGSYIAIPFGFWTGECGGGYRVLTSRYGHEVDLIVPVEDVLKVAMQRDGFHSEKELSDFLWKTCQHSSRGYVDPVTGKGSDGRYENRSTETHVQILGQRAEAVATVMPAVLEEAVDTVGSWWMMGPTLVAWRPPMVRSVSLGSKASLAGSEAKAEGIGKTTADAAQASIEQAKEIRSLAPKSAVQKNTLEYVGDTHVYRIKGPDGTTFKIGESATGVRVTDGASIRAEQQVRQLMKETGQTYQSEIRRWFADKASAREYETRLIERFRRMFGQGTLPGNATNR